MSGSKGGWKTVAACARFENFETSRLLITKRASPRAGYGGSNCSQIDSAVKVLLEAAQGVLLALALLTMQGNKTANRLLAALTLTISIVVSGAVLLTSNYVFAFPHLSRLHQPFVFLTAPLLFLYLRELTARERT